jgi:hypothetical protein
VRDSCAVLGYNRRMTWVRSMLVSVYAIAAAMTSACNSDRKSRFEATADRRPHPEEAAAACAAAVTGLAAAAPQTRVTALVTACATPALRPLRIDLRTTRRTATWLAELDAAVRGCGGFCSRLARTEFLRNVQHQLDTGEPSATPWRVLAEACPVELGLTEETRGFINATWFTLQCMRKDLVRMLSPALATELWDHTVFPLPAVAAQGRGLELPPAPDQPLELPGRRAVTVLATELWIGTLPWAQLTQAGMVVDGDYPGTVSARGTRAGVTADVQAGSEQPRTERRRRIEAAGGSDTPLTLLAPRGLPASRIATALQTVAEPARLAVLATASLPDYEPPMALRPLLTSHSIPGARMITVGDANALAAAVAAIAETGSASGGPAPLTVVTGADATVADLATVIATLSQSPTLTIVAHVPLAVP